MHFRRRLPATFSGKAGRLLLGSMLAFSLWLEVCAVPVLLTPPQTQSRVERPQLLRVGEVLNRQINGGETQSFTISVAAGQFLHIRIEQHGSILLATLSPPRRTPQQEDSIEMDSPAGPHGPVLLSTITSESGNYQLDVRSRDKWALPANYELVLETLRTAEAPDRLLIEAEKLFAAGRKKFRAGDGAAARDYYSRALPMWETANEYHWQALTQYALAEAWRLSGKRDSAVDPLKQTLRLLDVQMALNDWRLKASALNDLGSIYVGTQADQAADLLNQALALFVAHQDRRGQASALNNLARIQEQSANFPVARELLQKASVLRTEEHDLGGVANLRNALGVIFDRRGEPETARQCYKEALQLWDQLDEFAPADRLRVAAAINNVAKASDDLNDWDEAFKYYDRALAQYAEDDPHRAATLDNKGELFAALGDSEKARECYEKALEYLAADPTPDSEVKAGILLHVGQLFLREGDFAAALKSFEHARDGFPQRRESDQSRKQAEVFVNLGAVWAEKGDLVKALENYQRALSIQIKLSNRRGQALVHQKLGAAYARLDRSSDALNELKTSLILWISVKDQPGEAATLNDIALVERDRGNIKEALQSNMQATSIIESLRTKVSTRELRTSYFANQERYYEIAIDLRMQLGKSEPKADYFAAALESSEKARARVLLEALNNIGGARAELDKIIELNPSGVAAQRASLDRELVTKRHARTGLFDDPQHTSAQIAALDEDVAKINGDLKVLDAQLGSQNPRFESLKNPQPATLAEIQQQLDDDTLLLEYALGEKRSYVWVVSPDSIKGVELTGRAEIESKAQRVTEALTARNREEKNESFPQRVLRLDKAERDYAEASAALSKMVLEPVASLLGQKRLVVVADGALQLVPFAGLPAPANSGTTNTTSPASSARNSATSANSTSQQGLSSTAASGIAASGPILMVSQHEIITLPSMSVLALQRRELANRNAAPYALAVIADPVFDAQDERVAQAIRNANQDRKIAARPNKPSRYPQNWAGKVRERFRLWQTNSHRLAPRYGM